jgi:hypothetical protein
MPLSEKYLFVAAYLSSVNRKESDDSVFSGKQRGKRKKAQAGHDEEAEENASTMRVTASSRSFTMDRLASIFAQIASTGGVEKLGGGAKAAIALGHKAALTDLGEYTVEQIASSYGDSDLFASVSGGVLTECDALRCTALYSYTRTVLHCIVLYCTVTLPHCTVLCCTVQYYVTP